MKKRLLAMLLAVVTTITSVPTPVYAASDEIAAGYVDEETDADTVEEYVPDEAETIEVTDADKEEAVVTEESTEIVKDKVVEAKPVEDPADDNSGDAIINKPALTEEDAVAISNLFGVRNNTPKAQSLYGNQNYWFTEGEWDYEGGIANNKVFYAMLNDMAAGDNDDLWDIDPSIAPTYKFSVASGWNKDDKSKLSFKEIVPGSVIDVDGLQVSANSTWLHQAGDPAELLLVKDTDYYVDDDEVVWIYDAYKVGRKLGDPSTVYGSEEVVDGVTYRTKVAYWTGFKNGTWTGGNAVYFKVKLDEEFNEVRISEYYVLDNEHSTKGEDEDRTYIYDAKGTTQTVYYKEGTDIIKDEYDGLYIIDDYGDEKYIYNRGYVEVGYEGEIEFHTNVYEAYGYFDGSYQYIEIYRKARRTGTDPFEEYGDYYGERIKRTGVSTNSLSVVSVNKTGVYTVKAEISYTVSRNTLPDGSGDTEVVKVTDVGYATFFVRVKMDENAGWGKIAYELDGKKYVNDIDDYSKVAGLQANAKYKVEWTTTAGNPANNLYTADASGEFKSDKYWAPKNDGNLYLTKVSDAEAYGNCDSVRINLGLNSQGASFFDKNVFVDKHAPGLFGDKERNNYNAEEKESVKIDGLYGDNKFLYMKDPATGIDYEAAGTMGGLAYTADAAKGTVDIYPLEAGITQLVADIQYSTSDTIDGVENKGAIRTVNKTPVVLIVKEATPVGKIVGVENDFVLDEEGNNVIDEETMTAVKADFLKISDLEPGDYRLRSASDNHIIKGALAGDYNGDGIVTAAGTGEYVSVKNINGRWIQGTAADPSTKEISYVLVYSHAIKEDKVYLEKIHYEGGVEFPALNAKQEIVLSAEEIYVNIVPAMAGHTPVSTLDVEDGIQWPMNNLNYNVDTAFNVGQKGNGLSVFYNVTDVKWDGEFEKDGTFAKDKVYSATVKMSISTNETISTNVAFKPGLTAEDIHVNAYSAANGSIWIGTDAYQKTGNYESGLNLEVPSKNISDVKVEGRNLSFKVTFAKAFIQHETHYINVYDYVNGRWVVGDDGLADPVIYVAPGQKATVYVRAVNSFGYSPSIPAISCNSTLNNGKILWEEFFYPKQNGFGVLEDKENNRRYEFRTNDEGRTYTVDVYDTEPYYSWVETINDLTYDEFMAQYGSKYKMTIWNPWSAVPSAVEFTISANAAATGEDKIQFTAQNGTVITKDITIRYYQKAETPQPMIEYDRTVNRYKDGAELLDVITNLKPHTWYLITWYDDDDNRTYTNSFYTSENPESKLANKGEIFVENRCWYISATRYPISIREAYGEQPQKAVSDPASLVIKEKIDYTDLYASVDAPEAGENPGTYVGGMYNEYIGWSGVSVSPNSAFWSDASGSKLADTDAFGEKGTKYNITFTVRINKYDYDEDGDWNNVADYTHGETIYRGLDGVTMHVPGAIVVDGKESVTQALVNTGDEGVVSVNAVFATSEAGKVPMKMVAVGAENETYEPAHEYGAYVRSTNDDYAVSEGWGDPEGELRIYDNYITFPSNAAHPEAVIYTDTKGSVDLSVSMNDAVGEGAKKTRAQISANKCVGEYAEITSKIYNVDGSVEDNIYVCRSVYVKLPAPYTANNTDDTNYISGLIEGETYYAVAANGTDRVGNFTWITQSEYTGKAYAGLGSNKNVTGFKRLASWPDFAAANVRNTVDIRRCYEGSADSAFSSVDYTITLSSRIQKKGLYVTWPYGATDNNNYYEYDGTAQQPAVWVWYDGTLLDSNYYTVVYKNNVNASTDSKKATVYVKGKNGVKGKSNPMEFVIHPRDINNTTTYATDGIKETVTIKKGTKLGKVKINLYEWGVYSKPLKAKKDYTLDSVTQQFNSDGWLLINGNGNYTGTKLVKVIVVDKLQKLKINLANKGKVEYSYYRDGIRNVKPSMTVTIANAGKLTEKLDYNIFVEANAKKNGSGVHNVGTYKVYVMGQGIYGGKFVKKTFKITPKKLTDVEVNIDEIASWAAGYQYDNIMGATLERGFSEASKAAPQLKIVADNVDLGYSYNSKKYVRSAVDDNWFGFTVPGYGYMKYSGKGYDYMDDLHLYKVVDSVYVTYSKNKKLGTAGYTIKFGGNFKGTKAIKGTFKVAETNLNEGWRAFNGSSTNVDGIIIPDVAYTGKAGTYYSNPFVFYENTVEGVQGASKVKQQLYKKNRDYTVRYYKDFTRKDEITNKNKLVLTPGEQYATVYVRIEGKGGYNLTTDGKAGYIDLSYRVYDPKKVQGGCIDLKTMKYYNGDAKPVKVKLQYTPDGYVVTSGKGKNVTTITNSTRKDDYDYTEIIRRSSKAPNTQVSLYGIDRVLVNGKVVGYKNMKLTISGELEKEWFR